MSSSANEGEIVVSQTEVIVTKTEVSGNKDDLENVIVKDINKIGKNAIKSLEGFRTFILRGNVVDLAIGIVIGAAFTAVVNAVVGDIITPLIPIPGHSLSGLTWHPPYAGKDAKGNPIVVDFGALINAVISFLIVASVLYFFVVQPVNSLMKLYHGKEAEAPKTRECPRCYQAINLKATRCPFCTSHISNNGDSNGYSEESDPVLELPASLEKLSEQLAEKIVRKATTALEKGDEAAAAGEMVTEKV